MQEKNAMKAAAVERESMSQALPMASSSKPRFPTELSSHVSMTGIAGPDRDPIP